MEPEGLLPHLKVPYTYLYTEPAQSSPYPQPHFLKIRLNITYTQSVSGGIINILGCGSTDYSG
jgi:hypothetical protein